MRSGAERFEHAVFLFVDPVHLALEKITWMRPALQGPHPLRRVCLRGTSRGPTYRRWYLPFTGTGHMKIPGRLAKRPDSTRFSCASTERETATLAVHTRPAQAQDWHDERHCSGGLGTHLRGLCTRRNQWVSSDQTSPSQLHQNRPSLSLPTPSHSAHPVCLRILDVSPPRHDPQEH